MCKLGLRFTVLLFGIFGGLIITIPAAAVTSCDNNPSIVIQPPFDTDYTCHDLGSVPALPTNYGGLTFKFDDPNTILIGGAANGLSGKLYAIGVVRGVDNHITGFTGTAAIFADAAFNDGGVAYGPGNVLFLARWPVNEMGQTKPGTPPLPTDKIVALTPLGVAASPGGLNFVPAGFPGAGQLKSVSWSGGQFYTLAFEADGTGTFNITSATLETTIPGGPEGFVYIPPGSPVFAGLNLKLLVSEFSAGKIAAYEIDANGDPDVPTRTEFITGLSGAEGAVIDPLTGDFLFSTFGGGNRVIVVQGFLPPFALDHFLCYKAKTTAGTEKFLPVPDVTLTDQFGTGTVLVKKPVSLCNPAEKTFEGNTDPINDADTHLKGYQIKPATAHVPVTGIKVVNQFGELFVDTVKPDRLLVPTAKCIDDPPGFCPPTLPVPDSEVDHFQCYKVKVTKGTAKFPKGLQASVVDQFNQPKLYNIKKPTRLCAPVLDKEHPPGTHTLAKHPDVHLMCYQAKPAKGQPKHVKVTGIHVNNQFGPEQLNTVKEDELCVPSVKTLPTP